MCLYIILLTLNFTCTIIVTDSFYCLNDFFAYWNGGDCLKKTYSFDCLVVFFFLGLNLLVWIAVFLSALCLRSCSPGMSGRSLPQLHMTWLMVLHVKLYDWYILSASFPAFVRLIDPWQQMVKIVPKWKNWIMKCLFICFFTSIRS